MDTEWNTPFLVQGLEAWWIPNGKGVVRCDHNAGHRVWPDRPRFRIANGLGLGRASDKSPTARQYLCTACAWQLYQQEPPTYEYTPPPRSPGIDQGTMW